MSEWREVRLGDICSIKHGYAYKGEYISNIKSRNILVTPGNFTLSGGFKMMDKPKYYKGPIAEEYILKEGDLIVTMTDLSKNIDTLGYSALVPNVSGITFHHNQRIGLVENISKDVNKEYLYWLMRTKPYQRFVANSSSGTTVHHTSPKNISNYSFLLPSIQEQRRIASILSALDDKIAVNRKICENLEAQAQALFKHWFVDFAPFKYGKFVESELGMIPEGWRVVSLDEATSKFGTGLNPRQNFKLGYGNNFYVTIKNMYDNKVILDSKCDKIDDEALTIIQKRSKLTKGDLLFSGIGTIGRVAMVVDEPKNWNTSESVFNMHPANNFTTEFLYVLLLSKQLQEYVKMNSQGAVQQGIRMASLKAFKFPYPPEDVVLSFNEIIKALISKKNTIDKESLRLASLRDTLLPKLMSGEIKL